MDPKVTNMSHSKLLASRILSYRIVSVSPNSLTTPACVSVTQDSITLLLNSTCRPYFRFAAMIYDRSDPR